MKKKQTVEEAAPKVKSSNAVHSVLAELTDEMFSALTPYQALCIMRDTFADLGVCGVWKKIHRDILMHTDPKSGIVDVKNAWVARVQKILGSKKGEDT